MKHPWIQLLLLAAVVSPAPAQERRQGAPPPERIRERSMMATPEGIDRLIYFTTNRGKMGVTVSVLPQPSDSIGALVDAVSPGSPAFKAGIQSGDLITRFNGRSVITMAREANRPSPGLALIELAATLSAGDTARVEFRRGSNRRTASLVLEPASEYAVMGPSIVDRVPRSASPQGVQEWRHEYVGPDVAILGAPGEGPEFFLPFRSMASLELAPMNPGLGQYFGVTTGVLVISIPEGSRLNLRSGDVVTMIDGRRVSSPNQFFRILRSYDGNERFRFEVVRMKKRETVTASIAER